jgi:hypothetical protein
MTSQEEPSKNDQIIQTLEEICDNTRAIRRVVNRILDSLHESAEKSDEYDPDATSWHDLCESDDMYY